MMRGLVAWAVWLGLLGAVPCARGEAPGDCRNGRYVVAGGLPHTAPEPAFISLSAAGEISLTGCGTTLGSVRRLRHRTRVVARWTACDDGQPTHMSASVADADCRSAEGRLRHGRQRTFFRASLSRCGDGIRDPEHEACDRSISPTVCPLGCTDLCTCAVPSTSTTTSTAPTTSQAGSTTTTSSTTCTVTTTTFVYCGGHNIAGQCLGGPCPNGNTCVPDGAGCAACTGPPQVCGIVGYGPAPAQAICGGTCPDGLVCATVDTGYGGCFGPYGCGCTTPP